VVARRLHTTPAVLVATNHLHRNYLILGETVRYPVVVLIRPAAPVSTPALHRSVLARQALPNHATVRLMIIAAAKRHAVPAALALALAWQESGWQQGVVSGVDAIGVMQVLPSTGAALGRLHGRTYNLMLASDNIEAGVTLLRDLLDATGHTERALAGYYQGLGSIARYGVLAETKQYVANILSLRARFQ
jgi:soluble lytic murein transglycosylase-like protein